MFSYKILIWNFTGLPISIHSEFVQWKGSNCKQSARWQHVSRLKASALCIWYNKFWCFKTQQLILGTGTAVWWGTEPAKLIIRLKFLKPDCRIIIENPWLAKLARKMISAFGSNLAGKLDEWVETNPSDIHIFPTDIHFLQPHGTMLKVLIQMLIEMFADVR